MLQRLSGGHFSLEYETEDKTIVHSAIHRLYGNPQKIADHVTSVLLRIGGADFIYLDEWDYPCLISISNEGDAVLTRIVQHINEGVVLEKEQLLPDPDGG